MVRTKDLFAFTLHLFLNGRYFTDSETVRRDQMIKLAISHKDSFPVVPTNFDEFPISVSTGNSLLLAPSREENYLPMEATSQPCQPDQICCTLRTASTY